MSQQENYDHQVMHFLKPLRHLQRRFFNRLHRIAWERKLKEWNDWKALCYERDEKQSALDEYRYCDIKMLRAMIRKLAGINPVPHSSVRDEWSDSLRGPDGWRGCGRDSWDNAIKELENGLPEET